MCIELGKLNCDRKEFVSLKLHELEKYSINPYMFYISSMVTYILNPQDKLPPELKENNLGFIFVSNIHNHGANMDHDKKHIVINRDDGLDNYGESISVFSEAYKPENNFTSYTLGDRTSNSSKFIHALYLDDILEKWNSDWKYSENRENILRDFIEKFRDKFHIDENINIASATIIDNWIYLKLEVAKGHFVTIPMGYNTKTEYRKCKDGKIVRLGDINGNIFSRHPDGAYTDDEIEFILSNAHENGAKLMLNFYSWFSPEDVSEENYKYFHYRDNIENYEEALEICVREKDKNYVIHEFSNGKLVLIERVHDYGNGLAANQDQIMPDYGRLDGTNKEEEKYNYWKDHFQNKLNHFIDLGVDSFRIDLAHGFGKHGNYDLFKSLLKDAIGYAQEQNRKIYFVLETYDFSRWGGTKPATFRDWNIEFGLDYPAIKVYHKEIEENLMNIHNDGNLDNFMWNLEFLLQNIIGSNGEMMAISTFDDHSLLEICSRAGIKHEYILEMQLLLGKAGYSVLSPGRDFKGEYGESVPSAPGGEHNGGGKFYTHPISGEQDLYEHFSKGSVEVLRKSESLKLMQNISAGPNVIGIRIEKAARKLIFIFDDHTQKIFDFHNIIYNGQSPYIEKNIKLEETINLRKKDYEKLKDLKKIGKEKLGYEDLFNVYNHNFWFEFRDYIKTKAWGEYKIEDWDREKQEAYFYLNKERLVQDFLFTKGIDLSLDYFIVSPKIITLVNDIEKQVRDIFGRKYPDLLKN